MSDLEYAHLEPDVIVAFGDYLNVCADEILEAIDAPDQGVRDALNLLVNAALYRLRNGIDSSLEDVAGANYQVPLSEILDWINS